MSALDMYVPVAKGWAMRVECQDCGCTADIEFADDGFVPDLFAWSLKDWFTFTCPGQKGMFLRRFTLRDDNLWPRLTESGGCGRHSHPEVSITEIIRPCHYSRYEWRKLPADELAALYANDSHHFNVIALEGEVLGLRPVNPLDNDEYWD